MPGHQKISTGRIARLLKWYDGHRRDLAWRAQPGEKPDPYHVWLSEIMLQQTQVITAIPYFQKFTTRWPAVTDLAAAELDEILSAWAGLGYYARARNLHACARLVAQHHGAMFPQDQEALGKLPGIGPYTAAAIGAIAFNQPVMPVDGNIERVVARLNAIDDPLPGAKAAIEKLSQHLISPERPGDMAQALMDLGALICSPSRPRCAQCPLNEDCQAHKKGIAGRLPVKAPKPKRPLRTGTVFWLARGDGAVLLRTRPRSGLLGGMGEFPSTPWREAGGATSIAAAMPDCPQFHGLKSEAQAKPVRHIFTHFALELWPRWVLVSERDGLDIVPGERNYRWVKPATFSDQALPSVMVKVARHMLGE